METIKHTQGFVSHNLGLLNDRQRQDLFFHLELFNYTELTVKHSSGSEFECSNGKFVRGVDKIVEVTEQNGKGLKVLLGMMKVLEVEYNS